MNDSLAASGSWAGGRWSVESTLYEDGTAETDVRVQTAEGLSRRVGFGGPLLPPGRTVNGYVGRKPGFPVIVLARMAQAAGVRTVVDGEGREPVWTDDLHGVTYLLDLLDGEGAADQIEISGTVDGQTFRTPLIG